jgi:4-amino-4-deoxy-L-arabinose transferase-like glycosyltransferase
MSCHSKRSEEPQPIAGAEIPRFARDDNAGGVAPGSHGGWHTIREVIGGFLARHWPALVLFGVHLVLGLYYMHGRGLDMTSDPKANSWDFFWQTLPMDAMQADLWGSLWNLHAQPPLYNLYGFLIHQVYGPARHLVGLHYVQLLLGSLMCGMLYSLLKHMVQRPIVAFLAALIISLNPVIFLYEAFVLYTLLTAFLVVAALFSLMRYCETSKLSRLLLFILLINTLALTRSAYHAILLVPILVLGGIIAGKRWRRFLILALLVCLPTLGWYAKNQVKFGFFGASSWMGSNMWRSVAADYSKKELRALHKEGVIEADAVARKYFDPPSDFVDLGYNKTSDVDVLSRDDYNNINMIDISQMHLRNAKRLKHHDPGHYRANVAQAYRFLCKPSNETRPLTINTRRIMPHVQVASYLNGRKLASALNRRFGTRFTSFYMLLIPLPLVVLVIRALIRARFSWSEWMALIRKNAVIVTMAGLIFYVTAISCLFEYGENCRFKFSIEAVILMLTVAMCFPLRKRQRVTEADEEKKAPSRLPR